MNFDFSNDTIFLVFDRVDEGVYLLDENRTVRYWNGSAEKITGFTAEEVVGRNCSDNILNHIDGEGNQLCGELCPLRHVMETGREETALVFLHHKNGSRIPVRVHAIPVRDENGKIGRVLEIFSDTSEIKLTRRKIDSMHRELFTDPLTKVGNRRFADRELERFFDEFRKSNTSFAAVLCDIDDFKKVNDTYGHDFGDRVLTMIAGTMAGTLRDGDAVSRWGGEEFMILFSGIQDGDMLHKLVERIRILIEKSFLMYREEKVSVTLSFGATIVTGQDDGKTLFKRADELLFQSKREGKNRVSIG